MPLAKRLVDHYGRSFKKSDISHVIDHVSDRSIEEFTADEIREDAVLVGKQLFLLSDLKHQLKENHGARVSHPYTRGDLTDILPQFKTLVLNYEAQAAHYNAAILEKYPQFIELLIVYVEEMLHLEDAHQEKNAFKSNIRANNSKRLDEFYSNILQFTKEEQDAFRSLFLNNREHVSLQDRHILPTQWTKNPSNASLYQFATQHGYYSPYPFRNVIIAGTFDGPDDACMHSWGMDILYLLLEYHIGRNKPFNLFGEYTNPPAYKIETTVKNRILQKMPKGSLNPTQGLAARHTLEEFIDEALTPQDLKLASQLREHCNFYMIHLLKEMKKKFNGNFPSPEDLDALQYPELVGKYRAVHDLYSPLHDRPLSQGLVAFKMLFAQTDRQETIKNHRDNYGIRFLNVVCSLLSLGIKNLITGYLTEGKYYGFWKSVGGCLVQDIKKLLDEQKGVQL